MFPPGRDRLSAIVPNVPPGTYAAQAFHDEDDNGKLDRTLLGLPKEAMGFSKQRAHAHGTAELRCRLLPRSAPKTGRSVLRCGISEFHTGW